MRTLSLQDNNWSQWKFGDTNAVMTFNAATDGKVPDYANSVITFKLAQATSSPTKPGDYEISAPGRADSTGKQALLDTSELTDLKPGTYVVEMWLTDKDSKKDSIYPSDGFVFFTIDENTMGVSSVSNISTETLQAVYTDLLQKIYAFKSGVPGKDGLTPKLKPGNVVKLAAGSAPTFTLTQDAADTTGATYIVDVGLPDGYKGDTGAAGKDAVQPIFSITEVKTLDPGQPATATIKASTDLTSFDISLGLPRGDKGEPGKAFDIVKNFKSVDEMNASKGEGLTAPAYVMIASDVNDKDNGKLYKFDGSKFNLVVDLAGPQGATGPAPAFTSAKATLLPAGATPTATVAKNETGNYDIAIGIPKGDKGDTPQRGTDYWTDADKQAIQNEDKQYIDSKISDAYTKAAADMDKWLETAKF